MMSSNDFISNIILKLRDMCPCPECKFQKQTKFTIKHFQLEAKYLEINYGKFSKEHKLIGINFSSQQSTQQVFILEWLW